MATCVAKQKQKRQTKIQKALGLGQALFVFKANSPS